MSSSHSNTTPLGMNLGPWKLGRFLDRYEEKPWTALQEAHTPFDKHLIRARKLIIHARWALGLFHLHHIAIICSYFAYLWNICLTVWLSCESVLYSLRILLVEKYLVFRKRRRSKLQNSTKAIKRFRCCLYRGCTADYLCLLSDIVNIRQYRCSVVLIRCTGIHVTRLLHLIHQARIIYDDGRHGDGFCELLG